MELHTRCDLGDEELQTATNTHKLASMMSWPAAAPMIAYVAAIGSAKPQGRLCTAFLTAT